MKEGRYVCSSRVMLHRAECRAITAGYGSFPCFMDGCVSLAVVLTSPPPPPSLAHVPSRTLVPAPRFPPA